MHRRAEAAADTAPTASTTMPPTIQGVRDRRRSEPYPHCGRMIWIA